MPISPPAPVSDHETAKACSPAQLGAPSRFAASHPVAVLALMTAFNRKKQVFPMVLNVPAQEVVGTEPPDPAVIVGDDMAVHAEPVSPVPPFATGTGLSCENPLIISSSVIDIEG